MRRRLCGQAEGPIAPLLTAPSGTRPPDASTGGRCPMSFRSVAIPLIRIDQVGGKLWGIRGRVAYGGDETDTGDADEDSDDEQRDARASGLHAFIGQVSVSCHSRLGQRPLRGFPPTSVRRGCEALLGI